MEARNTATHLRDCFLSPKGVGQMEAMNPKPPLNIELVVTSPMSRALQTCLLTFANRPTIPIVCHPSLSEFPTKRRMKGTENLGRPLEELLSCPKLNQLPRFSDIDFSEVAKFEQCAEKGEVWWQNEVNDARVEAKMQRLIDWFVARPEQIIAVVGHCNNSMRLMNTMYRVPNAVPITCILSTNNKDVIRCVRQDSPAWDHWTYVFGRIHQRNKEDLKAFLSCTSAPVVPEEEGPVKRIVWEKPPHLWDDEDKKKYGAQYAEAVAIANKAAGIEPEDLEPEEESQPVAAATAASPTPTAGA